MTKPLTSPWWISWLAWPVTRAGLAPFMWMMVTLLIAVAGLYGLALALARAAARGEALQSRLFDEWHAARAT